MPDVKIVKQSLVFSASAALYVAVVATVISNGSRIFGEVDNETVAPIAFLLLLVVSASTMGLLIFGKPVMLYIDGKKREAVTMVVWTVGFLATFTALLFVSLALFA